MDSELVKANDAYKALQANFAVIHQNLDKMRNESAGPKYLKKEIQTSENEVRNLTERINQMKQKCKGKKDFQPLFDATSNLRKEQEEEAILGEKIAEAKMQIDYLEQQIFMSQQRLFDLEKTANKDTSAVEMLDILRKDVKRNRELLYHQIQAEFNEKVKKLNEMESTLSEPSLTHKELEVIQSEINQLKRENKQMEEKVSKGNPHDDKLSVYRQRLNLISKKRDKLMETIKSFEVESEDLESKIRIKEETMSAKGMNVINKENLKQ